MNVTSEPVVSRSIVKPKRDLMFHWFAGRAGCPLAGLESSQLFSRLLTDVLPELSWGQPLGLGEGKKRGSGPSKFWPRWDVPGMLVSKTMSSVQDIE